MVKSSNYALGYTKAVLKGGTGWFISGYLRDHGVKNAVNTFNFLKGPTHEHAPDLPLNEKVIRGLGATSALLAGLTGLKAVANAAKVVPQLRQIREIIHKLSFWTELVNDHKSFFQTANGRKVHGEILQHIVENFLSEQQNSSNSTTGG